MPAFALGHREDAGVTERYVFCPRCDEACRRLEFVYVGEGSIVTRRKAHAEAVILKHRTCDEYVVQVYREAMLKPEPVGVP